MITWKLRFRDLRNVDVRVKDLRQITTAVGDGGMAGQQVFKYIESLADSSAVVK